MAIFSIFLLPSHLKSLEIQRPHSNSKQPLVSSSHSHHQPKNTKLSPTACLHLSASTFLPLPQNLSSRASEVSWWLGLRFSHPRPQASAKKAEVGWTCFFSEQKLQFRLQSNIRDQSQKKRIIEMLPTNLQPTYNCLLFPCTLPTLFNPYQLNFLPPNCPATNCPVKVEEDDSKRTTQITPKSSQLSPVLATSSVKLKKRDEEAASSLKKQFKKDKRCPVHACRKKYSSRIALRAHIRKQHAGWYEETSDYEP